MKYRYDRVNFAKNSRNAICYHELSINKISGFMEIKVDKKQRYRESMPFDCDVKTFYANTAELCTCKAREKLFLRFLERIFSSVSFFTKSL